MYHAWTNFIGIYSAEYSIMGDRHLGQKHTRAGVYMTKSAKIGSKLGQSKVKSFAHIFMLIGINNLITILITKHTFENINIYYLCLYNKKNTLSSLDLYFVYIQKIFLFDQQHYTNLHHNIKSLFLLFFCSQSEY
jgi:hypothetical protein